MTTQLPAHLLALFSANPEITEVGKNVQNESHAKIRYNGKKWRLTPLSGEEIIVNTPNLDVIIVDINEHKSHIVFEKAYDPKGEPEAPVWSSDDGTPVPVEHEGKVVSDYRRVAVILADQPEGGIYELRVSAASITNFDRYNTTIRNHGIPIGSLVTTITFDAAIDYPKLVFAPAAYLNEEQTAALSKAFTTQKAHVQSVIGKKKDSVALTAPATQTSLPDPQPVVATAFQLPTETPTETVARKPRAKKVEAAPVQQPVVLPMSASVQQPTAASAVVTAPQNTSSELDTLLSNIMGKK